MKRVKLLLALLIFASVLWVGSFFQQPKSPGIGGILTDTLVRQIEQIITTPSPLRAEKESPVAFLTQAGVIEWTNIQRKNHGLVPLAENALLSKAALSKAQDMLENQYFAHESLSGLGVADLANEQGYEFIMIGENLALGNFENDQVLVQAWMDSPGHRANILNERYQEIGAAVIRGIFEGSSTWLAVQHFGLPLSVCPQPDPLSKGQIDSNQEEISSLQIAIIELEKELKSIGRRDREAYNQKAEEYNNLISQYNSLIEQTKSLVEQYNSQVTAFNLCVSQ